MLETTRRTWDMPAAEARAIQIVATPGSGDGRALDTARRLRTALRRRGHRATLRLFADLTSLRHWAACPDTAFSLLIVVGGDGTQSAAAVAAVCRSVPLLPVPAGFGNLFARALGHSGRGEHVPDLLEHGTLVRVDVGIRNHELFLCQESFGLLREIQDRAEVRVARPCPRWRRSLEYYRAALHYLFRATLPSLEVRVDGRTVARDAVVVTVANVETYGSWLRLAPTASPTDGLLDVFVMGAATRGGALARLLRWQLRLGEPGRDAPVWRGRRVVVAGPQGRDEIGLVPGLLPVVVSHEAAEARGLRRAA
jgi:diacylglycerol kinase (ATP)